MEGGGTGTGTGDRREHPRRPVSDAGILFVSANYYLGVEERIYGRIDLP